MVIAICDDNPIALQKIKDIVDEFILYHKQTHSITVRSFSNGEDLQRHIQRYGVFDLLILDIVMPGINGIDLAKYLRSKNDNCRIIFLTNSPEFAIDSYKVSAFYYLLKSDARTELKLLLQKALDEINEENCGSVVVKEKGRLIKVPIHSIHYLECINHTVYFHLHKNEVISCYSALSDFSDALAINQRFVKCHKSFIVNLNYVMSITNKDFIMDDNTPIPISRQAYKQIKDVYLDFFFGKEMR